MLLHQNLIVNNHEIKLINSKKIKQRIWDDVDTVMTYIVHI